MKVTHFSGVAILVFFSLGCSNIEARTGISIASGYGAAHIVPIRLGVQKSFEKHWWQDTAWPLGGYWEGSFYAMNGKAGPLSRSHKHLIAAAIAGVFRFERACVTRIGWPYVELGIGLSWLNHKEIGGRDLGIHFQFEDRIGIGVRFGANRQYDVGYKAIHFSNAYIGPSNHGINLHVLMLGYWF